MNGHLLSWFEGPYFINTNGTCKEIYNDLWQNSERMFHPMPNFNYKLEVLLEFLLDKLLKISKLNF
jgi:hypothetical protein